MTLQEMTKEIDLGQNAKDFGREAGRCCIQAAAPVHLPSQMPDHFSIDFSPHNNNNLSFLTLDLRFWVCDGEIQKTLIDDIKMQKILHLCVVKSKIFWSR